MAAVEGAVKFSKLRMMAVLFLPRTLAGRLTALGFIFGIISALLPYNLSGWTGFTAIALWVWAYVAAFRSMSNRSWMARFMRVSAAAVVVAATYLSLLELTKFLGFIAAGAGGRIDFGFPSSSSPHPLGTLQSCLVIVIALLLVWVPQVFFRIQLDVDGAKDAQDLLLLVLAAVSSVLTGIVMVIAHFDGGPLRNINNGTLVVGVVGVIFLIAPLYRSLAKMIWRRGVAGVLSPARLRRQWRDALKQLEEAHNRTIDPQAARSGEVAMAAATYPGETAP